MSEQSEPIVAVDGLVAEYDARGGVAVALAGVDLRISRGERLGIVGESGSGKTTLALALGGLLPGNCRLSSGVVSSCGTTVRAGDGRTARADELRTLRREKIAFIAQDPAASLDPTTRIGRQFAVAMKAQGRPMTPDEIDEALSAVRIERPGEVRRLYPHQVSGGMAQRIAIAMAVARRPQLLIADEPTAALDVEVRSEVLSLIVRLAAEHDITLIWVSHDIPAVRRWCTRAVVMNDGRVVEQGPVDRVLVEPEHPYARELVNALRAGAGAGEQR
ncbi:ABC transporter ATP-binding protein [Nocardioides sp. LHD-245]|uniref:ABC transporter ATP-binding protein n=1 Tax=Nocardioides sp. LHD-245 TaxID=3051387 RepID=UPI0027E06AA9|nr:ABC transporter ATP-binding protein [Nocardioides sp. LHD-245]